MISARRIIMGFLLGVVLVGGFAQEAMAQSRGLQTGPVVRRQLLFRSDRFELTPMISSTIAPVYQRTLMLSLGARYHFTNAFALGLNVQGGVFDINTGLANDYEELRDRVPGQRRPDLLRTAPRLLTDLHISVVPLHGKANLFGRTILHWDFYLTLGIGGALVSSESDDLSGFRFGPAIGVGLRTFVHDKFAVNFLFQDYLYSSAEGQATCCGPRAVPLPVKESFRNHMMLGVGVSIFFPSEVRVSR